MLLKDAINETGYAYLQSTWIPHKEKFILAWIKNIQHFGHVATSRVEGGHATLKKCIAVSTGDLATIYEKLVLAAQQQRQGIGQKVAYDRSQIIVCLSGSFWTSVNRKISHYALNEVCNTNACIQLCTVLVRYVLIILCFLQVYKQY